LKLRRGTEAFRGNGTPAEWTNRQTFGAFRFPRASRPLGPRAGRGGGPQGFSRCERFSASRAGCARATRASRFRLAPDAESEADEAPPGCWKSFGTTARRQSLRRIRIAFGATRFPRLSGGRA